MWRCNEVEVDFNQEMELNSDDIPIRYLKDGVMVTGFADPKSYQIKNTSKLYPPNSVIHPSFYINGNWWCMNGKISLCSAPEKFKVDISSMKTALDNLANNTVYDGGLTDRKSQEDFSRIVSLQQNTDAIRWDFTTKLAENDIPGVRKALDLEHIEDDLFTRVYNNIMAHPVSIKVFLLFGTIGLTIIIYLFWSCNRCGQVRKERHEEKDKTARFSKINYWWEIFSHNKLDTNLNTAKIEKLKTANLQMKNDIRVLYARLEALETADQVDRNVPPPYIDTLEEELAN